MFKYGKKKPPQGATRHVAKNASSEPAPSSRSSLIPSWLLVGFGTALGLFVAVALYLWQPWKPSATTITPEEVAPTPAPPKEGPRFEFYDLLPNQKVNTPTEVETPPVNTQATATTTEKANNTSPATSNTNINEAGKKTKEESNKPSPTAKENAAKAAKDKQAKTQIDKEKAEKIKQAKAKAQAKVEQEKNAAAKVKYTLQAGSFKNSKQADQRRASIAMSGLPVKVMKVTVKPGEDWYRVVVGPFNGKDKTSEARQTLSGDGIDSLMVKVDKK